MNAKDWKRLADEKAVEQAVDLILPSGMTIKARRPNPLQLAHWDRMPFSLAAATQDGETMEGPTQQEIVNTAKFMQEMVLFCCLNPRISMEPKSDDEIHPRDIPQEDWLFIVHWALRSEETAKLRPFRSGAIDDRGRGDGQDVSMQAVEPVGNRG
jgi:hypothetical protein